MNYPLISEYIESIKAAEDNFDELSYLLPVLNDSGQPVMTSGNFAVVFKMEDQQTGKLYAVKCFTREQERREDAYRLIDKELKRVESSYMTSVRYLDKELFVDTDQTNETEFPVLLMDWVDGKTLDKYLRENLDDKYALEMLAYRFSKLAQRLIPQPFAHGDLKPDNILVREDGTLVLVDYDGMYVPAMKGQKARELGSPDFRHPLRTEDDFDEHIDDFPLVSILLSLKAVSINPTLLKEYGEEGRLLFSEINYRNPKGVLFNNIPEEIEIKSSCVELFYSLCANIHYKISKVQLSELDDHLRRHGKMEWSSVYNQVEKIVDSQYHSLGIEYEDYKKVCKYFDYTENLNDFIPHLVQALLERPRNGILIVDDMFIATESGIIINRTTNGYNVFQFAKDYGDRIKRAAFFDSFIEYSLVYLQIPDFIVEIGKYSFKGCDSLIKIDFSNQIKRIDEYAFEDCAIKKVTIPHTVEYIGCGAFKGCVRLEMIVFEGIVQKICNPIFGMNCLHPMLVIVPKNSKRYYKNIFNKEHVKTIVVTKDSIEHRMLEKFPQIIDFYR